MQYLAQSNFIVIYLSLAILITVAYLIYTVFKKEQEFQEQEQRTFNEYKHILKKADARARTLIDRAAQTASHLYQRNKQNDEVITQSLDTTLQKIASGQVKSAAQLSEQARKEYEEYLQTVIAQLHSEREKFDSLTQSQLQQSLSEFTRAINQTTTKMQEAFDQRTDSLFTQAKTEIDSYKKLQMEAVDKQVSQLINKTYEKVLRKTIPENVHYDLIMQAFEEAKSESIFSL